MGLLAPLFLIGLLGIAVPVWLHRREGERRERRPVSSLMYFEPGERASARPRRVRDWWLLALRALALALLCLVFAQPVLERALPGVLAQPSSLSIVVVDTSLSMRADERWERALDQAGALLDALGEGDVGQLVSADARVTVLTPPTADAGVLRAALSSLEPSVLPLRYGALLGRIETLVEDARTELALEGGTSPRPVVHFVSDFQRVAAPARWIDRIPSGGAELALHPVAGDPKPNWALEQVRAERGAQGHVIEAVVRGIGAPARTLRLELRVDGETRLAREREIGADARAVFELEVPELPRGEHRAQLVLDVEDALDVDDRRQLVLVEEPPGSLLFLNASGAGRDAVYVEAGLGAGSGVGLELTRAPARSLPQRSIGAQSMIVLADVPLEPSEAERLREYVRSGRSVWVIAGERLSSRGALELTGHRLGGLVQAPDPASPFRVVRSGGAEPDLGRSEAWAEVQLYRHAGLRPLAGDEVLLRSSDGAALLIEHRLGAGRVWILGTAFDPAWTDLTLVPVFLPFLRSAASWLAGVGDLERQRSAGERLALGRGGEARDYAVQLLDPEGNRTLTLAETRTATDRELDRLGFYTLIRAGEERWIAVNPDPLESDLRAMDAAELERWAREAAERRASWEAREGESTAASAHTPLAGGLLWVLVLILVFEPLASQWVRHPARLAARARSARPDGLRGADV